MPHGTVSGFLPVEDGRIYFEVAGMGPHLVFIHGFSLDHRMWDEQWEFFRGSHTCIRYDVRGHGRSAPPRGPWADHDDLMLLLAHLGIDRANLCGLSMGGGIALDVAVSYPHAVRSLVLLDSGVGGYRGWSAAFIESLGALRGTAATEGVDAAKKAWLSGPLFGPAREQPEVIARIERIVDGYGGWHWLNDGQQIVPDPLPFDRLDEVKAPTLVVAGERDEEDFLRIASFLGEGIRGARRALVPGVGHMSNMEAASQVNNLVAAFLTSLPGEGVRLARTP